MTNKINFDECVFDDTECLETIDELNNHCDDVPVFSLKDELHLAKVVSCYDGDSFKCVFKHDGKYQLFTVRMFGYDSAEIKVSKKIPENIRNKIKEKAILAREKLKELILNKFVFIKIINWDKYGRLLAVAKINKNDKQTVNEIMINDGFGVEYYGGTKDYSSSL